MPDLIYGQYTITDDLPFLEIRSARNTTSASVGKYYKNDTFRVYQVFPESAGIVWGRVSENIAGAVRYVGMRVNNHLKVVELKEQTPVPDANSVFVTLQIGGHTYQGVVTKVGV